MLTRTKNKSNSANESRERMQDQKICSTKLMARRMTITHKYTCAGASRLWKSQDIVEFITTYGE